MNRTMTKRHPQWNKFTELLMGKEGCNFRNTKMGGKWKCAGGMDKSISKAILEKYFPEVDIKKSMKYFEKNGGHCDCEIIWNIALV